MRPAKNLSRLERAAKKRILSLKSRAISKVSSPSPIWNRTVAAVAIEAQSAWSIFIRSYYISCMLGAKSREGLVVNSAVFVPDVNSAIGYAIRRWRPSESAKSDGSWDRRKEPTWHDTYTLVDLSSNFQFTNCMDIAASLSMQATAFRDLPVFRNFFAHRGHSSCLAACNCGVQHGIVGIDMPSEILRQRGISRPQALVLDWLDEIEITIELLCT